MDFFKKMKVYTKVPRHEALQGGHKIISTRWLDVNKGDLTNLDYRSRLVGREINTESRLDLFALFGSSAQSALRTKVAVIHS